MGKEFYLFTSMHRERRVSLGSYYEMGVSVFCVLHIALAGREVFVRVELLSFQLLSLTAYLLL